MEHYEDCVKRVFQPFRFSKRFHIRKIYLSLFLFAFSGILIGCAGNTNQQLQRIAVKHTNGTIYEVENWFDATPYVHLDHAINAIGTNKATLLISQEIDITPNALTIPGNITLQFLRGGYISTKEGETVTINGPVEAGRWQIFAGEGSVEFGSHFVGKVSVEWFGAVGDGNTPSNEGIQKAINSLPVKGGVVFFPPGVYTLHKGLDINEKERIIFRGINDFPIPGAGKGFDNGSTLLCENIRGKLFSISSPTKMKGISILGLRISGYNMAKGHTISNTWSGLIEKVKGVEYHHLHISDCIIEGSNVSGAIAVDLSNTFWVLIENTQIRRFPKGKAIKIGRTDSTRITATTTTLRKVYMQYVQECVNIVEGNVLGVDFYDCVFESSTTAIVAYNTRLLLQGCHFENIGYVEPDGWGKIPDLSKKNMNVNFGKGVLQVPVDAAITTMYCTVTINSCNFAYLDTTSCAMVAWFEGIGRGSKANAGGSLVVRGSLCHNAARPFFRNYDNEAGEKHNFSYKVYDGGTSHARVIKNVTDARCLDRGYITLKLPDNSSYLYRQCEVDGGKFIFGIDRRFEFNKSNVKPSYSPSGGKYIVGDMIRNYNMTSIKEPWAWVCTKSGAPGEWREVYWKNQ